MPTISPILHLGKIKTMNPLTAKELFHYLSSIEKDGHDLSSILVYFRNNSDSDVEVCTFVGEDLFDSETNSRLESIILVSDSSDYQ